MTLIKFLRRDGPAPHGEYDIADGRSVLTIDACRDKPSVVISIGRGFDIAVELVVVP